MIVFVILVEITKRYIFSYADIRGAVHMSMLKSTLEAVNDEARDKF